eukprot:TRINITY_DN7373_c0_g1_i1.p2 TRINITY_DN7373_c0_g1~~TRINITY_DN7373_c0_g1_i1.p2  ORF type:complete len:112 (-),score=23.05 TRINITY_DN7373_c0_g1_i1:62-397(-)
MKDELLIYSSGPPPASYFALKELDLIVFDNRWTKKKYENEMCVVCADQFVDDDEAHKLDCNHIYHVDCIIPWLTKHNTCPVCRFELSTGDPLHDLKDHDPDQQFFSSSAYI